MGGGKGCTPVQLYTSFTGYPSLEFKSRQWAAPEIQLQLLTRSPPPLFAPAELTNHLPRLTAVPSFATSKGAPLTFTALELLAAVADADINDTLTITSIPTSTEHGGAIAASADGASFTYTPVVDWVGVDTAQFVVSDGKGSVPMPVHIDVQGESHLWCCMLALRASLLTTPQPPRSMMTAIYNHTHLHNTITRHKQTHR